MEHFMTQRRTLDVETCSACGFDHLDLPFWRNSDSGGVSAHPAWIGMCPEEGEPLAIVETLEGVEKVVAMESGYRKGLR